jgi:hypothetical protein
MSAAAETKKPKPDPKRTIKVTVTFPLASKPPYHAEHAPETTIETVRGEAMEHFGVHDDESNVYFLTHKGERLDPNATLTSLEHEARALKLTLAKELIQG